MTAEYYDTERGRYGCTRQAVRTVARTLLQEARRAAIRAADGAVVFQMVRNSGVHLLRLAALLLVQGIAACGGCVGDDTSPWALGDEPTSTPSPDPCIAARELVAGLGLVDDATLARRPADKVVEILEDYGADGTVEGCWLSLYDADGHAVVSVVDHDRAPGPERLYWMTDFDDRAGKPRRTLSDLDADGVWDFESTAAFDQHGEYSWSAYDEGADGTIDARSRFVVDETGFLTRQEADQGDDGTIDSFDVFTGDDLGRIITWDSDWDADGVWDRRMTWTFGITENIYTETVRDPETGATRTVRHTDLLDAQGRVRRSESDIEDDGVIDQIIEIDWQDDTSTTRYDFDADGHVDGTEVEHWHRAGDALLHGAIYGDYDNDGQWDEIRIHTYAADGRLLTFESADPQTERPSYRQTYVWGD